MAAQEEKCTLIVGGQKFEDWESVWVQKTWGDSFHQFRFTCAERENAAQIMPEAECSIELAGELAITGMIVTRQVAFDGNNHGVMLQGVSDTWSAARSSIIHETNSFDDKTFMQIAEEVLKPTGIKGKVAPGSKIDDSKFERMHTQHGESIFAFLDRIGRPRKIIVTCNEKGEFIFVGERQAQSIGSLVEGQNIRSCQAIISISTQRSEFLVDNSTAASDPQHGTKASEQQEKAPGKLKRYSPIIVPHEQPVWKLEEVKQRVKDEAMWTEAQQVQATFVVQGWKAAGGKLWEAGSRVSVQSKMARLPAELSIQSVTYTQDDSSGTLTTLLCVKPAGLNESDFKT